MSESSVTFCPICFMLLGGRAVPFKKIQVLIEGEVPNSVQKADLCYCLICGTVSVHGLWLTLDKLTRWRSIVVQDSSMANTLPEVTLS